jgi:DNA-binding IclR family transcriptional regulator
MEIEVTVASVAKSIAILKHLAASKPQGVNAIARAVGLSPSSCFNILKTLVEEHFVDFDGSTKLYSLSSEPSRIFAVGANFSEWKHWLHGRLEVLATDFAACCGLWEVRGNRVILVDVVDSPHATRIHLSLGQRLPVYLGAMGRCIAAREDLKLDEIGSAINELRWQVPPRVEDYARDIHFVREHGWATDEGNYLRGVTTIASAIAGNADKVTYCLTTTVFSGQYDRDILDRIGHSLATVAGDAEARFRHV